MKVAINTTTFGQYDPAPLEQLKARSIEYSLNPHARTLRQEEVVYLAQGMDGLIAGTEPLNEDVLNQLSGLKVISRCGAGLDNVDLKAARNLGIQVFSTPTGPTLAVAELTVGVILNLLRKVNAMNSDLKNGQWKKQMGNLLYGKRVGIIGFGRIGQKVA